MFDETAEIRELVFVSLLGYTIRYYNLTFLFCESELDLNAGKRRPRKFCFYEFQRSYPD